MSSCIGKIRQNISKKQSFFSLCVKKCGLRVVDEQNPLFLLFLCTTPCVFLLLVPRPVLWLMCDDESRPWAGVRGPLPFFCCFCCGIAFCLSVLLTTSLSALRMKRLFLFLSYRATEELNRKKTSFAIQRSGKQETTRNPQVQMPKIRQRTRKG